MSDLGYDRWLESGPGGPYDDSEERPAGARDCMLCEDGEGLDDEGRRVTCTACDGRGWIAVEVDDEPEPEDDEPEDYREP